MDERVEAAEGEGGEKPLGGADVSTVLSMQARRTRASAKGDPLFDAYLSQQTRLATLQAEHLHEQRELVLSRLRWGRFGDRMRSLLQVMTVLVGVAVALVIGAMAWQAHEAHGLVIEAFSVPPDLARGGLTGQVAAGRFLDKLQGMQAVTANSDRPAQSYESNWGSDFKVEIPDTGLTFSEIEKLMRERLGHVSHVSGEVLTAPSTRPSP